MTKNLQKSKRRASLGASMVETALLISLIACVVIPAARAVGASIQEKFEKSSNAISANANDNIPDG